MVEAIQTVYYSVRNYLYGWRRKESIGHFSLWPWNGNGVVMSHGGKCNIFYKCWWGHESLTICCWLTVWDQGPGKCSRRLFSHIPMHMGSRNPCDFMQSADSIPYRCHYGISIARYGTALTRCWRHDVPNYYRMTSGFYACGVRLWNDVSNFQTRVTSKFWE